MKGKRVNRLTIELNDNEIVLLKNILNGLIDPTVEIVGYEDAPLLSKIIKDHRVRKIAKKLIQDISNLLL